MKKVIFILALSLLQTGCAAFQRDVKIADEVLQEEETIVNNMRVRIPNNAGL